MVGTTTRARCMNVAGAIVTSVHRVPLKVKSSAPENAWVRRLLVTGTILFLTLFIVLPAANVCAQAFAKGCHAYTSTFHVAAPTPDQKLSLIERRRLSKEQDQAAKTWAAIRMTTAVAAVVVPLNVLF